MYQSGFQKTSTKIWRGTSNLDKFAQKYLGLYIEAEVRFVVPCGIKSPQKCSLPVKCIGLLQSPRRKKHYPNAPQCCVICALHILPDFRLPTRSRRELRSSIPYRRLGTTFQAPDRLSLNVGTELPTWCVIAQKSAGLIVYLVRHVCINVKSA
jgi:hypothetical protein